MPKPKPIVLLTRPQAQSERFADGLRAEGIDEEIVISPLLKIEATGAVVDLAPFDGVIFTSRNAVELVPASNMTAWCVGAKTAEAAQKKGWRAISADGDVDDLLHRIEGAKPRGKLLHLRGEHSRGSLVERLRNAGVSATDAIIYRQQPTPLTEEAKAVLSGESPVIVPLFSPRTAAFFAKNAPYRAPILGVAMSRAVGAELGAVNLQRLLIADAPDADSMRKSVLSLVNPV